MLEAVSGGEAAASDQFKLSPLQSKMKKSSRRGSVQLKGATVGVDDEDARSFTVENRSKKYRLQGKKAHEG